MKISYSKYIQCGAFDKEKFIKEKLKVLSDMDIALTETETDMLHSFSSPRHIEDFIRAVIISRWN